MSGPDDPPHLGEMGMPSRSYLVGDDDRVAMWKIASALRRAGHRVILASDGSSPARVAVLRHLALGVAALTAYAGREQLHVGNSVLWILACAAVLNLQPVLLSRTPRLGPFFRRLSPLFALAGWLGLMLLTGGATSPFVAGLWLEIVLAAMATSTTGVMLVTCGGVAGLWMQQRYLGWEGHVLLLALQTGFLVLAGMLSAAAVHRRESAERQQSARLLELRERLTRLESELDEARTLGQLGENAAHLGHALKNAAHTLRGFTALIEPKLAPTGRDADLLDGMREAIGRLEEISRTTLRPNAEVSLDSQWRAERDLAQTIREVVRDVGVCFPEVRWSVELASSAGAGAAVAGLREALTILLQNAAEAMDGRGEIDVELRAAGERVEIRVRDHGPGIAAEVRDRLFLPGVTTKADGHGFGLFLARRLLAHCGGELRVKPMALEGGAGSLFAIELPPPPARVES